MSQELQKKLIDYVLSNYKEARFLNATHNDNGDLPTLFSCRDIENGLRYLYKKPDCYKSSFEDIDPTDHWCWKYFLVAPKQMKLSFVTTCGFRMPKIRTLPDEYGILKKVVIVVPDDLPEEVFISKGQSALGNDMYNMYLTYLPGECKGFGGTDRESFLGIINIRATIHLGEVK